MLRHRPHGRRSPLGRSQWWPWPHQTGVATELGAPLGRPGLSDPLQARVLPNGPILLTLAASRSGTARLAKPDRRSPRIRRLAPHTGYVEGEHRQDGERDRQHQRRHQRNPRHEPGLQQVLAPRERPSDHAAECVHRHCKEATEPSERLRDDMGRHHLANHPLCRNGPCLNAFPAMPPSEGSAGTLGRAAGARGEGVGWFGRGVAASLVTEQVHNPVRTCGK